MKNLIMTCLALAVCANMSGQKLDAMSRVALQQMKQEATASANASCAKSLGISAANTTNNINAVVKLQEGADLSELTAHGFEASDLCSGFAIVHTTMDDLAALAELESVERISIAQRKMELMLNQANAMTGVDLIHDGFGFSGAASDDRFSNSITSNNKVYTGKGVMIGVLDSGFDPNHPMFLNAEGKSRFKMIKTTNGKLLTTPEEIANFTTDNQYNSHATHVAGIAAGNYMGSNFQLQGVATGADLAMGPVSMEVSNLEYLKYLGEYCKKNNERLVINMSFGQNVGPHDGTDVYTQALNEIIKKYDIVACMSAGNQANLQIIQKKTLESDEDEMKAIYNTTASINTIDQYITTSNPSPINMDLVIIRLKTKQVYATYPIIINGTAQNVIVSDDYLSGHIYAAEETIHDGLKGYSIKSDDATNVKSGYLIGYVIKGEAGQELATYSGASCPYYTKTAGWNENFTGNGSILNEACGEETIIVGAYVSKESATFKSGTRTIYGNYKTAYGCTTNDILSSSSFGTTYTGEDLPHICAPGAYIESAANRYETVNTSLTRTVTDGTASVPFCSKMGTSMSSPYMAGVAALWLEANPLLTHQEIKEIAMKTAINDKACNEDNHFIDEGRQAGAGKIDAYAGLMYILNENETTLIKTPEEKSFLIRQIANGTYEAYQAGATTMSATLYNMDGKVIASNNNNGNTISINTSNANKGIYLLKVSTGKSSHIQKIVIR